MEESKKCSVCKKTMPVLCFSKDAYRKDGFNNKCRKCNSLRKKEKKAYLYDFLIEHFKENPCISCEETNPILLDFDHLRDKKMNIAEAIKNMWSLEKLQDEIDKCQVLCSNCHRMKTAKEHSWYMYKKLYGEKK